MADVKRGFDNSLFQGISDHLGICPLSENQRQCTNHNRLAGSGLAGDNRQSVFQIYLYMLNKRIIGNRQFFKHGRILFIGAFFLDFVKSLPLRRIKRIKQLID